MGTLLHESLGRIADPGNLDASVEEVFNLMLGGNAHRGPDVPGAITNSVTAVVGFGGSLSGACILRAGTGAAIKIAAKMTGAEFSEIDETVQDGIGELCNMIAGSWKGTLPELAATCGLSVPAVISGRDYTLHVHAPEFVLSHIYCFEEGCFEDGCFEVKIVCERLRDK